MSTLIRPLEKHVCHLSSAQMLPLRSAARCDECGNWSRVVDRYVGFGSIHAWAAVRWYHWRLRRRIKDVAR